MTGLRRQAELGTRSILLYVRIPEPRKQTVLGPCRIRVLTGASVIYINQIKILVKSQLQPISQLHFDSSVTFLDFDELDIREIAAYVIFDLDRDKFRVQGGITAVNFFPFTVTGKLDLGSLGENDFV